MVAVVRAVITTEKAGADRTPTDTPARDDRSTEKPDAFGTSLNDAASSDTLIDKTHEHADGREEELRDAT